MQYTSSELATEREGYLQLRLFCLPVQVLGLVLLQTGLQLVLGLAAIGLCSLQLPQQLCTPAREVHNLLSR